MGCVDGGALGAGPTSRGIYQLIPLPRARLGFSRGWGLFKGSRPPPWPVLMASPPLLPLPASTCPGLGEHCSGTPGAPAPPYLPPQLPSPRHPWSQGSKITQQCPGVGAGEGGFTRAPRAGGAPRLGVASWGSGWGPHHPPCLSLWCYGPCHPPGDRGGLSPTVSLSRWGQNWGPCRSTAQVLPPFPPLPAGAVLLRPFVFILLFIICK